VPRATPPNNNNDRQAVRGLTKASMNHCMQLQHLQAVPACPVALQAVSACIFRMSECCFASGRPRPVTLVKPRQLSLQRRRCGSARLSVSSVSLQGELCCGITHSFSATALAASSIAVKAGERPLLGGGLPAGAGGGAGFFSTFRRAKYLIRCYHSK
jgi:hypothetical protein